MASTLATRMKTGRPYRTAELRTWAANPSRDLGQAVKDGTVVLLRPGLYVKPKRTRFGPVPPDDHALMRAFLGESDFVFTGPERWNALGLGTTAAFARTLVYNRKRSGEFKLGNRTFSLSRRSFPKRPTPEWFAVDLFENAPSVGVSVGELATRLTEAVRAHRLDPNRLRDAAAKFGTRATRSAMQRAVAAAA